MNKPQIKLNDDRLLCFGFIQNYPSQFYYRFSTFINIKKKININDVNEEFSIYEVYNNNQLLKEISNLEELNNVISELSNDKMIITNLYPTNNDYFIPENILFFKKLNKNPKDKELLSGLIKSDFNDNSDYHYLKHNNKIFYYDLNKNPLEISCFNL